METLIVVVAADLKRSKGFVMVGPETARVCRKAAQLYVREQENPYIYLPAGWSDTYGVFMGDEPMRAYLEQLGVPAHKILSHRIDTYDFTTHGEMSAFADFFQLRRVFGHKPAHTDVIVVARWWHAPRALRLLRTRLRKRNLTPWNISAEWVWSCDIIGMLREPLAWLKNRNKMLLRPVSS